MVDGEVRLDLAYEEDKLADVDANIVMAAPDRFVEVQGTAEGQVFTREQLDHMLELATRGAATLFVEQRRVLEW